MKKYALIFIVVLLSIIFFRINGVELSDVNDGKVVFDYAESDIHESLNASDLSGICKMFCGKIVYTDNPSCGFSESVSIQINEGKHVFCIARDGCEVIYWKNEDKYFKLSKSEIRELHQILRTYGCTFPCV